MARPPWPVPNAIGIARCEKKHSCCLQALLGAEDVPESGVHAEVRRSESWAVQWLISGFTIGIVLPGAA